MRFVILSVLVLASFYTVAQNNIPTKTEYELVVDLQNRDADVRESAAAQIQDRLAQNKVVVQPGNIIEHSQDYWEKLVNKYSKWTSYDKIEKAFNLDATDRTPNFGETKAYRLDHQYILYIEQNEKGNKARVSDLILSPQFYDVDPPRNFTGTWKIFDVNGVIQRETVYNQGKKHGLEVIYHDNGTPCWSKVYFLDAIMELSHFSTDGELLSKEIFDDERRAQWEKDAQHEQSMMEGRRPQ